MPRIGTPWHVCVRFSERESICALPSTPHTILRKTTPWQRRLCVLRYLTSESQGSPLPFVVLHELHLIHTDLKPENILLVNNQYSLAHIPVPGKVIC
jgi:serine/threonine protein kinase